MSRSLLALVVCTLPLTALGPGTTRAQAPASPAPAIPTGGEVAAQSAADVWLAIVDDGRYDEGYKASARIFQGRITLAEWVAKVAGGRNPLGKLKERKYKDRKFYATLPGAPDGQYVVVRYDTAFEKKAAAVETVTMTVDPDGQWKVCGYFIR